MRRLAALTFVFALVFVTWTTRAEATRRALVIGQNVGLGPDAPLRFAEDDATAVGGAFAASGAVAHDDLVVLTGTDLDQMRAALRSIAARSAPDDELLFFFSGHGGPDGAHADGQVWSWDDLRTDLDATHARLVVAFVDACFSGALLTPKGLTRESPLVLSVTRFGEGERGRGHYLVTSSGANELSFESEVLQGSPFAAALRSGVLGAADANADGRVTLPELYDYVYGRTLSATVDAPTGPQHPVQSVWLESAGQVVLVDLARSSSKPVRGAAALGRCYVLDGDASRVVAELERPSERVFLVPADYVIKCVPSPGGEVKVARARLGSSPVSLDGLAYRTEPASTALAKGPGAASESRFSLAVGVASDVAGALLVGYQAGSHDLLVAAEAGMTWKGVGIVALGTGIHVPWWRVGRTEVVLGVEAAGILHATASELSLGGGSFVAVETARLVGPSRGFARLDLLATHPVDAGSLEATLVGSVGLELGK
jgi:hypothetical protein